MPRDLENGEALPPDTPVAASHEEKEQRRPINQTQVDLYLREQKLGLVDAQLEAIGMGRYQWCLFFLCGFGYMLDLLWAQAFGLILAQLQQELGFPDSALGNIITAFSAGMCAGAFLWGVLIDVIGRRWGFNLTILVSSIFGLALGAPTSYDVVVVLAAFVGLGVGGNIPIDATMLLEFIPERKRHFLALLFIFQPIGVVFCSAIAYGVIPKHSCAEGLRSCNLTAPGQVCCTRSDNMGWRYLMFTLGGITLFTFFARVLVFRFYESPKYLVQQGRDNEAIDVLHKVIEFNRSHIELYLTSRDFKLVENSFIIEKNDQSRPDKTPGRLRIILENVRKYGPDNIKMLFKSSHMRRITLLTWIIYACDFWGFTLAGAFLPIILERKGTHLDVPLQKTYKRYIIIYCVGIPAVALAMGSMWLRSVYIGPKSIMIISSALMAVSLFAYSAADSMPDWVGLNAMEYFFQSLFNAVLYAWTPNAFPTGARGTACGTASFWGRLASIIAPIVGARMIQGSVNGVLYLAGGGGVVCTAALWLLPRSASWGGAI